MCWVMILSIGVTLETRQKHAWGLFEFKNTSESGDSLWTKVMVPKQGFHNNAIKEPHWVPHRKSPLGSFYCEEKCNDQNKLTVEMSHGY